MTALYNEIEPYAVGWLKNLVDAGHIAPGAVEPRSIRDLSPDDVRGATQFHAFAGIGVWSHALRLAGWPDDLPVWTGSCPCQPFSGAGKRKGVADDRHLWPEWFRLIRECRPSFVFGEQVASGDGLGWFDAVQADLEGAGYAVGAADMCAAGVGAPHLRQRLYFCAVADLERRDGFDAYLRSRRPRKEDTEAAGRGEVGVGADAACRRTSAVQQPGQLHSFELDGEISERTDAERSSRSGARRPSQADGRSALELDRHSATCIGGIGARPDPEGIGRERRPNDSDEGGRERTSRSHSTARVGGDAGGAGAGRDAGAVLGEEEESDCQWLAPRSLRDGAELAGATRGFWAGCDWWPGIDGKWRPTQPGIEPLAHGAPARVGRLRAYGNAIVAPLAATFIRATAETLFGEGGLYA